MEKLNKKREKKKGNSNPYAYHNQTVYLSNKTLNIIDLWLKKNEGKRFPYTEIYELGMKQKFPQFYEELNEIERI